MEGSISKTTNKGLKKPVKEIKQKKTKKANVKQGSVNQIATRTKELKLLSDKMRKKVESGDFKKELEMWQNYVNLLMSQSKNSKATTSKTTNIRKKPNK